MVEQDRVNLEGQEFAMTPFVGTVDVGDLLDLYPDGLSPRALGDLALGVLRALAVVDCTHGDLSAGSLRLGEDGVRLVGLKGRDVDDAAALADLIEDWGEAPPALLHAVRQADLERVEELHLDGVSLFDLVVRASEPPLFEHPWTGRELTEATAASGPPPKVRTAAIASMTLALGWLAAWFYLGAGA